ncbi:hypothetical protein KIPB_001799 [Kipferlia bialata]|uniref:Glutathione S-transferase C-terminal domain-containing protein n=1 Tax=Kipferlia bialata TaxID=797122 RepID=A0A9K3CPG5_9EUKA|nr:hypothetical protein KIPB_001799 [Kipferlia bialata]|eukprot:g1799.t1
MLEKMGKDMVMIVSGVERTLVGPYACGEEPCYADFALGNLANMMKMGGKTELLEACPKLAALAALYE